MLRKPIVDARPPKPPARPPMFIILITSFPLENLVIIAFGSWNI